MIYLYYLNGFGYEDEDLERFALSLPEALAARVFGARSEKVRRERALAYIGLTHVMKTRMSFSSGAIDEDSLSLLDNGFGKLTFEGLIGDFSISHSSRVCLIAYCDDDGARVGVDIETLDSKTEQRAKRVAARFLRGEPLYPDGGVLDKTDDGVISIESLAIDREGRVLSRKMGDFRFCEPENRKTLTFTMAEALLKCDGRGFRALTELDEIRAQSELYVAVIRTLGGANVALSVARNMG